MSDGLIDARVAGMVRVYVAGPFRAGNSLEMELNIRRAELVSHAVLACGHTISCPHTMTRFFQDSLPDQVFIDATLAMMVGCEAVLVLPYWHQSAGTKGEVRLAERLGMPIAFLDFNAISVLESERFRALKEALELLVPKALSRRFQAWAAEPEDS